MLLALVRELRPIEEIFALMCETMMTTNLNEDKFM